MTNHFIFTTSSSVERFFILEQLCFLPYLNFNKEHENFQVFLIWKYFFALNSYFILKKKNCCTYELKLWILTLKLKVISYPLKKDTRKVK